jgi:histone deacetylase 1/2
MAYEMRLEMYQDQGGNGGQFQSSVNSASRGRSGFNRGRGSSSRGRGRGRNSGGNSNNNSKMSTPNNNNSKPRCQICDRPNHSALECWYMFEEDYQPPRKSAGSSSAAYGVDTNWYADSGATDHVTSNLEKLSFHEKYGGRDQVHTANGTGMLISNIGHTTLHSPVRNIYIKNILHVPTAQKSLASVHRLAKDNNALLEFHSNFFLIKDKATRRILHQGRCEGGLYPLELKSTGARVHKHVLGVNKPSTERWHSRLGHPSSTIVSHVLRNNKLPCNSDLNIESICDSCQRAKSHQLPYSKSHNISSTPLELVHSDIWGPAPTSVGRHTYYVSFIDDYSRYTWIYLLRRKSDVFHVFHEFQKLVERQFDRKILCMQTDWGGEYEKLNSFFKQIGIMHRVSCPHAHQQNRAAERKHRHIVEVGLALLATASMPLKFWDEAFLTATYLINMLPSRVTNLKSPTELLHNIKPDYTSLRIFGCACWPNLRPFNSKKLAFRSTRCVFLGYSYLHKGFKCLEPSTGRVYVSRDVVFDENIFHFASMHENAGARLRQEVLLLPEHLRNPSQGEATSIGPMITDEHANLDDVQVVAGIHEYREENSDQFEHQMRPNGEGKGGLPNSDTKQDGVEV